MTTFTITSDDLRRTVATVAPAASIDETRPVLCSILVELTDGELSFTATDSYRLHRVRLAGRIDGAPFKVIVPAGWLVWATRRLRVGRTVTVDVTHRFELAVEDERASTRVIDGDYPDFDVLFDTDVPDEQTARVNPRYLCDALQAAAEWSEQPVRIVALHPTKQCRFTVNDPTGVLDMIVVPMRPRT